VFGCPGDGVSALVRDLDGVAGVHVYDVCRVGVVHVVAAAADRVVVVDELPGVAVRSAGNLQIEK